MEHHASLALVERVLAGDEAVYRELIAASWPRLGQAAPAIERAELEQEAAGEIVAAARGYLPERDGEFAAYATGRARQRLRRLLRRAWRHHGRDLRLTEADHDRAAVEPTTRFTAEVESPRLAGALARLSPRMRMVIVRMYWQGRTSAEVAAEQGIDAESVRRTRRRAELTLRRLMQRQPPRPPTR